MIGNAPPVDSLILSFDMNNSRSWIGRPTTNLLVTTSWGVSNCMGRSDERPYAASAHTTGFSVVQGTGFTSGTTGSTKRIPEPPVSGRKIWAARDSSPDNYSRLSPFAGMLIDDLPGLDTSYVVSMYFYLPPGSSYGTGNSTPVCQANTSSDWHTSGTSGVATYNATYNYWASNIRSSGVSVSLSTKSQWQRVYSAFTPSTTIRNQESGSSITINRLTGYFQAGMNGSTGKSFLFMSCAQLEEGTFPSPYVHGTRTSAQALLDLARNYTFTVNSLTYETDGTFSFDGTSGKIDTNVPEALVTESWSVVLWAKFTTLNRGTGFDNALFGHGSATTYGGLHCGERQNKLHFGLYGNDLTGVQTLTANTWYCIAFTYNALTKRKSIYINGALDVSAIGSQYTGVGTNFVIGSYPYNASNKMSGNISMFNMYSKVLTPSEVQQLFINTRGKFGI